MIFVTVKSLLEKIRYGFELEDVRVLSDMIVWVSHVSTFPLEICNDIDKSMKGICAIQNTW